MMKKMTIVFVLLAFACASLLMTASCAKKAVKVEGEGSKLTPPPAAGTPTGPTVGPTAGPTDKEPAKVDDEAARKAEAERQARLRELEKAQKMRAELQAFESTHIYFEFDKSDLKPEARVVLEKKAAWLRTYGDYKVRVEGHCDDRGTNEYNLALGERRANTAFRYLNALGISADRMSTISYGEERPVCTERNEGCWTKNRRDEFKLVK
ncbi:MAG: peptidoglycan-associated lipoprotein Pal [Desulfobacterales bacterium]|nr:peptidoglycan-associated lipoprotein Pal [Desulfobacterales bacterium]